MEPNLAGMILGKRRFIFVQMTLILIGGWLLGVLKQEIKPEIEIFQYLLCCIIRCVNTFVISKVPGGHSSRWGYFICIVIEIEV